MTTKHWFLVAYVVLITSVMLIVSYRAEHPKSALQVALERTRDSLNRSIRDEWCVNDFAFARDRRDSVEVIKGHGPIFGGRAGACYIDAQHQARWRP